MEMASTLNSVDKALDILDTVARSDGGIGIKALSAELALPAATTHRLLTSLARHGLIVQDSLTKTYGLGPAALRLGHAYEASSDLVRVSRQILTDLTPHALESTFVTQLIGDAAICVASAESPGPLRFFMRPGQRMPFHAAASARAILAYQPDERAEELLRLEGLERYTTLTPRTLSQAIEELRKVREAGYAVCDEEIEVGVTALSVPVRGATNEVIASVTVVAPRHRLQEQDWHRHLSLLAGAAARLSNSLGLSPEAVRQAYPMTFPERIVAERR